MAPAAEIAPALRWPGTDATVAELLTRIDDGARVERLAKGSQATPHKG